MPYSIRSLLTLGAAFAALQNAVIATPVAFDGMELDKRTDKTTTITLFSTATATAVVTATPTCAPTTPPTPPAFGCDRYGYFINNLALVKVDPSTSDRTVVKARINGNKHLNSMGYNPLDHYLYALEIDSGAIVRIAADASVKKIATRPAVAHYPIGEVDSNGQYWVASGPDSKGVSQWSKINLNPFSNNYGSIVQSGKSTLVGVSFVDWSYIPSAGQFLWSLGSTKGSTRHVVLLRFNMANGNWVRMKEFPAVTSTGFGGCYASNNGDLFCQENSTGRIFQTNVFTMTKPTVVFKGPAVSNNDAARCVYNTKDLY
ncbi:hypothetical protein ABW19_dt0201790 [Dactylella cylindrospora]|nr:hypothetical protein ABW19_dt0201790 [Dactylella cylindrospora]